MIQDYGFRIYNPTIGKFLSVDPLTQSYPWYTPYQFAGNKPIAFIDLDGLEEMHPSEQNDEQIILEVVEFISITVRDEIPGVGEVATYREEGAKAMVWGVIPFGRHLRKGFNKAWKWTKGLFKRKPKKAGIKPDVKPDTSLEPPTKVEGNLNENSEITTYNVNTKTYKSDLEEVTVSSKRGEPQPEYIDNGVYSTDGNGLVNNKPPPGSHSKYEDKTRGQRATENRETDLTRSEFEGNLENAGYEKKTVSDGINVYTKGDKKYTTRDVNSSGHDGSTADYINKNNTKKKPHMKIRLKKDNK